MRAGPERRGNPRLSRAEEASFAHQIAAIHRTQAVITFVVGSYVWPRTKTH